MPSHEISPPRGTGRTLPRREFLRLLAASLGGAVALGSWPRRGGAQGGWIPSFPDGVKAVLDLSPFPSLFWVPATTLLGRMDVTEWARSLAVALAWCGALALLGRSIFRRGYLQYSGVGI